MASKQVQDFWSSETKDNKVSSNLTLCKCNYDIVLILGILAQKGYMCPLCCHDVPGSFSSPHLGFALSYLASCSILAYMYAHVSVLLSSCVLATTQCHISIVACYNFLSPSQLTSSFWICMPTCKIGYNGKGL